MMISNLRRKADLRQCSGGRARVSLLLTALAISLVLGALMLWGNDGGGEAGGILPDEDRAARIDVQHAGGDPEQEDHVRLFAGDGRAQVGGAEHGRAPQPSPGEQIEGDPVLGHYASLEELQWAFQGLVLSFVGDDWPDAQAHWTVGHVSTPYIPFESIAKGREVSTELRRDIEQAVKGINEEIVRHSHYAHGLLEEAALDYVRNKLDRRSGRAERATIRDEEGKPKSRYSAAFTQRVGEGTYVVEFQSRDYPVLEAALTEIAALRAERFRLVRAMIQ